MNRAIAVAAAVAIIAAGVLLRRTTAQQTGGSSGDRPVRVLLTLGEKAKGVERWDGKAAVSGGTLLATHGRHFSAGDEVTTGGWKCVTRKDEVAPYADIHYTEMRPGSQPQVRFYPIGVYLTVASAAGARVSVETAQGNFDFSLPELGPEPREFLNGRATARIVPHGEKLTTGDFEDDEPSAAALPDGSIAVAWVAYRDRADRIFIRTHRNGSWSSPEEVTPKPADIWRSSLVADKDGNLWAFWSERDNDRWHIWARQKKSGSWQTAERLTREGSNTFHRAAASPNGEVFVAWQSYRDGQSDIYLKELNGGSWTEEIRLSESKANDWEPAIAAGADGTAFVAWDSYDKGNYDIQFRSWKGGAGSPLRMVTSSPKFQAHASVAVDGQNRPWLAWDESGENWGKDQGFLITVPLATPLHQQRWIRVAMWDGNGWQETRSKPAESFLEAMRENNEHPQIVFDGQGTLRMVFRHWTRRVSRSIGSPLVWENYVTGFDGSGWSTPQPVPDSGGSIEKHAALARDREGAVWAAWMTDNRPFRSMVPENADVFCARLSGPARATIAAGALAPIKEEFVEAIPVHSNESQDVRTIRAHTIRLGGAAYRIYRGDMHRHTDVSQDFKYDGSLIEVYRYAFDAAGMDYIVPTDHQSGFDQEFTWWQNQKLVDLFHVPGSFVPLFGYERSLPFPNGHRNVVWAQRGVRTLPIPEDERLGKEGARNLYEYLHRTKGISMPHSSATRQGTNWRDNDPEVEPLMEIYQGYRTSYEYEGAPKAASTLNQHAQKSGWQPEGFWWNALAKGYKIGVQSSSDHWSTHISYACIVSESFTREGMLEAMRKRHAYAATDNIVLEFRARSGQKEYLMGDAFSAQEPPQLLVRTIGTGTIKQIDLIRNRTFLYTTRPGAKEASFEYRDKQLDAGESWYYVRVLQEDGQIAWSSPIWVKR